MKTYQNKSHSKDEEGTLAMKLSTLHKAEKTLKN